MLKNNSGDLESQSNLLHVCVMVLGQIYPYRFLQRRWQSPIARGKKKTRIGPSTTRLPPEKTYRCPARPSPEKRFINPNSSPKKPYTTKNEAPKKRAKVVPEKTNMLPKKHARKNEHLLRKNKNVLPEKNGMPFRKNMPLVKKYDFPTETFFRSVFPGGPKKPTTFFRSVARFSG